MEIYKNLWKYMEINENLWKSTKINEILWNTNLTFEMLYILLSPKYVYIQRGHPERFYHVLVKVNLLFTKKC